MPTFLIQHTFQGLSGTPEDRFVNTFHVEHAGIVLGADYPVLAAAIRDFYTVTDTADQPVNYWLANVSNAGETVKIFNLADVKPRSPVYQDETDPSAWGSGSETLPFEVAICLSYSAAVESGVPVARRRGRIYIGPLSTRVLNPSDDDNDARVIPACRQSLLRAAQRTHQDIEAIGGWTWVVYSPTSGDSNRIVKFWVDDAFDTQRRRGTDPRARDTQLMP